MVVFSLALFTLLSIAQKEQTKIYRHIPKSAIRIYLGPNR